MLKQFVLSSLLMTLSVSLFSQLTLNVGYNGAYFNPETTNKILTDFDNTNEEWDNPLGEIQFAYGILAGFNYRIDDFAFNVSWYNQSIAPKASGMVNDEEQFRDLFIRNNSYSLGIQGYIDFFSIGGAIEYQNFVIKSEATGMTERTKIVNEGTFATRLFLDFALVKGTVSAIHLRPYIQLPFNELNVFALEQELNPTAANTADPNDFNERLINFGISLYFSNGEQRD